MKKYIYKDKEYLSLYHIKQLLPNVGIPDSVTDEQLAELGITAIDVEPSLDELKRLKLGEVDVWTANKITGGFISSASGQAVHYDSDKDTQLTMQGIALNVDTPLFDEKYPNGCPIRGYKYKKLDNDKLVKDCNKTIFMLSSEQVMRWQADLSIHIGECKKQGWRKQDEVNKCTTVDELNKVILE